MGKTSLMTRMVFMAVIAMFVADAGDTNNVFSPCSDAKVQKGDGYTFGIAISSKENLYPGQGPQFSPCDKRLGLSQKGAQLAMFRPKVDEISLLTVNISNSFNKGGSYMVAFAGQKYAARSPPIMVTDNNHTITSVTLVLEFLEGTLQNLYWKSFGCDGCSGENVCLNKQDCAVPNSKCKGWICNIGIQLTFSGTDKNLDPLNSWYEVQNLRQYSLFTLYTNLRDSIIGPFENLL